MVKEAQRGLTNQGVQVDTHVCNDLYGVVFSGAYGRNQTYEPNNGTDV